MLRTFKISLVALIVLIIGFGAGKTTIADDSVVVPIKPPTVQESISTYATQYGISPSKLLLIAKCESGFRQDAIGDKGLAIGIFQFHQTTWDMFSLKMGEHLDIHSYADQAKLAAWAFANNLSTHWSCSKLTHYVK